MRSRYFRYLFEKLDGGLFHIGSVYSKENQKAMNYIYMVGSGSRSAHLEQEGAFCKEAALPEEIDLLVVGSYAAKHIYKLLEIVRDHAVKTVILPYLVPIQRLALAEEAKSGSKAPGEAVRFLQDPYLYLKERDIEHIYFLYGNGTMLDKQPENAKSGIHFEEADKETLFLIREMEGYAIPAVRAGYLVENECLFYFGVYGLDIRIFYEFIRDYFSHIENINQMSENVREDYEKQMKRLVQEYLRKFGNSPATTVAMFAGPLYVSHRENDSFMTEKEICIDECRAMRGRNGKDGRYDCAISCAHNKDYDNMQHHKRSSEESRFGVLMLGNANLNRYFARIMERFSGVAARIRGVSVPNCGSGEEWNHRILELSAAKDRIYWICGKNDITSAGVVSDIVLSSPNNRFLSVDENRGCCLSGYIVPKEDLD